MKRADRPLRRASFGLACALLTLLPAAPAAASAEDGTFTRAMLRQLNRVRASHHLSAVREDRRMDRGALSHSRDMSRRGYFAHGSWPGRVMASAGSARSVGEVIGWRVQSSPSSEASNLVREWLGSPPHRRVLLDGDFRRVGIGRATATSGSNPTALYTVDFAG
ncbi:MAG TPA: CAP domain-containing protein [Conexibacter sp.]|nr:CAP domain-containing protein [Conexibacter sp.]